MDTLYDVIIVGGGPAGLSAAIYMARAKYRVLVLEKDTIGGQITISYEVVNYPGIAKTDGKMLTETMRKQAEYFGAKFEHGEVTKLSLKEDIKKVTANGKEYHTLGVILAVGASPRKLGFPGEKEYMGKGIAYCATCDGEFFSGQTVFVIGGGYAAAEEAIFLTRYAKKVIAIVREEEYTCAKALIDEVKQNEKIEIHYETEIKEAGGNGDTLQYAEFQNNRTGETFRFEDEKGFGIFVYVGYAPATEWLKDYVACNEQGYLVTDYEGRTNVSLVYGAGDVRIKALRQVVTAVSDGALAATALEHDVAALRTKLQLPDIKDTPAQPQKPIEQEALLDASLSEQVAGIINSFSAEVLLDVKLKDDAVSEKIKSFAKELEGISDKLCIEYSEADEEPGLYISKKGEKPRIAFHGVPGGHEFTSFVTALCHPGGKAKPLEPDLLERINQLENHKIKILATLSCTMCPDTVMACQKLAYYHSGITAEMYDIALFPDWKDKYHIKSVPCMIIDDDTIKYGRQTIESLVEMLGFQ